MNTHQVNNTRAIEYFTPVGLPGIPLNSTETAVRNLAISMLYQCSEPIRARIDTPHDPNIARYCQEVSRQYTNRLVDVLQPAERSVTAGSVRHSHFSEAERICGLSVASSCIELDPANIRALSMVYRLLPNDRTQILVRTENGLRALDRHTSERAMFEVVCQNPRPDY